MTATVAGELLTLLAEKAAWWPRGDAVLIADPHLGKADSFRAAGVVVPTASVHADLARLSAVLATTAAARLVILGDLFHDRASRSAEVLDAVQAWRDARPDLRILHVRGNHDERAGDPPATWRFDSVAEPWPDAPFAHRHFPEPTDGLYTLAGHLHPSVTLRGVSRQRLRLPCFWFGPHVGVLPAFGGFTGTADVRPRVGDQVFVVADGEVLRV